MKRLISRRRAIGTIGMAGLGTMAASAAPAFAQTGMRSPAVGPLPPRTEFLIRRAYVMTMDPVLGDISGGDVHVRNGAIVAVGRGLQAPGAAVIDGRGMIVMPGLVETHFHMWNSLARSISGDTAATGYFPTLVKLGKVFTPDDMYQGARLSAVEALYSGITHVHDWCHNVKNPAGARADIRALHDVGIRGRFSYGYYQGQPPGEAMNLADIERLHADWKTYSNEGLLALGVAWRGIAASNNTIDKSVSRSELDTARRLGLPLTIHATPRNKGQIPDLAAGGMLGKDVQVVHATNAPPSDIALLAAAGSPVSVSPLTELRVGFGVSNVGAFIAGGITIGFSVDTTALSGNANMFGVMKMIENLEDGRTQNEFAIPARRIIEIATIEGARSMGLDERIGSLRPGKRADIIMIDTSAINDAPAIDMAHTVVEAVEPANVDTVIVDGRILKRHGKLTAIDVTRVAAEATAASRAIRLRAG
jgi:cytosine/adenosine deaminase-related metal-dependent hydrolase